MAAEKKEGNAGPEKSQLCSLSYFSPMPFGNKFNQSTKLHSLFGIRDRSYSSASLILADSSAHLMGLTFPLLPAMALQLRTHRDERFRDREKINEEVIKG